MPNNWKTYKFEELYLEPSRNGVSKPKSVRGIGFKMVNMGEIFKYSFISNQVMDRVQLTDAEYNKSMLAEGDLLFARQSLVASGVGKCILVNELNEETTFESHLIRVRLKNAIAYPKFIYYKFQSQNIRNIVISLSNGVAAHGIKGSDLQNIELELPPLPEQKSIASILSAIDDKIENNLAINKTLEEMAMALYKHWFVDFGPFQDGEFVESELGRIPKGWEVKNLGSIVSVLGGYAFKSAWFQDSGVKVLKIKNINNNIVDINNCTCISEEISKTINPKFRVTKGDFLIAMTGAEVGKVGAVPDYNQELWLNQRVGKLVDKELKNASILIGKLLQTNDFYKVMQGLAYGSAQPNISTSDIESIKIALPIDKSILNEIIDEFVNSHEIIIQNLTENQTLTQFRDTLLPKLISGEVRLKEFMES